MACYIDDSAVRPIGGSAYSLMLWTTCRPAAPSGGSTTTTFALLKSGAHVGGGNDSTLSAFRVCRAPQTAQGSSFAGSGR